MMRTAMIAMIGLTVGACASLPAAIEDGAHEDMPVVDLTGGGASCAAEAYQVLVGQPAADIHVESLPRPHRIYGRGDMVTMDYRSDRLNIIIGDDGRVADVRCG